MKKLALILLLAGLTGGTAFAAAPGHTHYCPQTEGCGSQPPPPPPGPGPVVAGFLLTVDVPASLTGLAAAAQPWNILSHGTGPGAYAVTQALPDQTPIAGLHRMNVGDFLLSVETPTALGGTIWTPQDVFRYSPLTGTYACFFNGAAMGIAPSSGVDALFLLGGDSGSLVVSFNAPTKIGATIFQPADLAWFNRTGQGCSDWVLGGTYLSAQATTPPIPANVNVVGADLVGGRIILSFDVPVLFGGTLFLRGDLVSWDGTAFGLFYRDPAWPGEARLNDVTF